MGSSSGGNGGDLKGNTPQEASGTDLESFSGGSSDDRQIVAAEGSGKGRAASSEASSEESSGYGKYSVIVHARQLTRPEAEKLAKGKCPDLFWDKVFAEAEAKEEAAEGVLLIVHFLLLCVDPLLIPCHIADPANELFVGDQLFRLGPGRKPREAYLCIFQQDRQFTNAQSLLDEVSFGLHDPVKVCNVGFGEKAARHRNANPGRLGFFGLLCAHIHIEAFIVKMLQQPFGCLRIEAFREGGITAFIHDDPTNLVAESGGSAVFSRISHPLGNGEYQPFAFSTLGIDFNCHMSNLLVFG